MFSTLADARRALVLFFALIVSFTFQLAAKAVSVTALHTFNPGILPDVTETPLVQGGDGNFYGVSTYGGAGGPGIVGSGTIFKVTPAGVVTVLHSMIGNDGVNPVGPLAVGLDGNLYGVAQYGGSGNVGTVFEITPSGTFTVLHSFVFNDDNGNYPSHIIRGSDGNFYGTTLTGPPPYRAGTIFEITPGGDLTTIYTFGSSDGTQPNWLVQDASGNFFGTTEGTAGSLFELSSTNVFTVLQSLSYGSGPRKPHDVVVGSDGNLYGAADTGSTGVGCVYRYSFAGSGTFSEFYDSASIVGGLLELTPGNFVGTAQDGTHGSVFNLTVGGTYSTLHTFSDADAGVGLPSAGFIKATDGSTYAPTDGGTNGVGGVCHLTTGNVFSKVARFQYTEGGYPNTRLLQALDGNYYATTFGGGGRGYGTIYKMSSSGTSSTLYNFTRSDGQSSVPLTQASDQSLYGAASKGFFGEGELFSITTGGVLSGPFNLGIDTGQVPSAFIEGDDGNFYGEAKFTNGNANGYILKYVPGTGLSAIYTFTDGADGRTPVGGLVDDDSGNFLGVASFDGNNGNGTVFRVTKTGQLTTLHSFTNLEGSQPVGPLVLANGVFYGVTTAGGLFGYGTVYTIDGDNNVTVVHSFTHDEASGLPQGSANGGLAVDSAGVVYGTTATGGVYGKGSIFAISPAGDFWEVYDFTGSVGANPSSLLVKSNGTLIGAAKTGGAKGYGSVFVAVPTRPGPQHLVATPGIASVSLTWDADPFATTYNVYRGTTAGGESSTPIATGLTSPNYLDSTASNFNTYYYKVASVNAAGTGSISAEAHATPSSNTASFVAEDTTTLGNWKGVYGSEGWNVIGDTSGNNPSFPVDNDITPGAHSSGVWAAASLSPKALQVAQAGNGARMAGLWYQTSWSMNVNLAGTHKLALYLLDYTGAGYAEKIQVKDATTGYVYDTRTISNFTGGVYEVWNVTGDVNITFTSTAGHFAVLSGIFLGDTGPKAPNPPTNLAAATGVHRLKLTWTAASGATSYNIYRGTASGAESATPVATGVTGTTFTDTGLSASATYYYKLVAVNAVGGSFASTEASGTVASVDAAFVKVDTTTQGNWKGVYGVDGWNVIGDGFTATPGYATITPGTHGSGIWAASSLSPAALQAPENVGEVRLAGVWYQTTSWTINLNIAGGPNQVALYLLDYLNAGYTETITIKDATTGTVIDTHTASNFSGGAYYVWNVNGNVTISLTAPTGHLAVLSGIFFGGSDGGSTPAKPTGVTAKAAAGHVDVKWNAVPGADAYLVYRGTTPGGESTDPVGTPVGTTFTDNGVTTGTYYYKVVAYKSGSYNGFASDEASATMPTATATFVGADTSTQGSWKGSYGRDGYNVIGDTSGTNPVYPGYATVTPGTHNSAVWTPASTAANCLQKVATGSTSRMAGVWYQTSWSMNVNVTSAHKLSLYLLDFPNSGYAETITIKDVATGIVLDTESASSFNGGVYECWQVNGNVTITLTSTAGHWAVLSGIFFE